MTETEGTFCLVLHSHLPWLPHHGNWPVGEEWLYQAWAHSYVPLVDLLHRFADEGRRDVLTLGVTPVLAAQLDDPYALRSFSEWLGHWTLRAQHAASLWRGHDLLSDLASAVTGVPYFVDAGQALQFLAPGLFLTPKSGAFDYVQVSLQGARTSEVLFLTDGVRINNRLYASTSPLDSIPSNMIERVEVLKGGQSLYYGTQAVGGIVNVVTRGFSRETDGAFEAGVDTNEGYHLSGYARGSTGDPGLGFWDILLEGLAPDGGLYVPTAYPSVGREVLTGWRRVLADEGYAGLAYVVLRLFIDDIPDEDLRALCERAYNADVFSDPAIVPVTPLADGLWLAHLSNGPTAAFKDLAMQLLGQLFEYELTRRGTELNILGATSGDTSSGPASPVRASKYHGGSQPATWQCCSSRSSTARFRPV